MTNDSIDVGQPVFATLDRPDSPPGTLDETDLAILGRLAMHARRRQGLREIATAVDTSRKTVGQRVKRLIPLGYAHRPEGPRRGVTVTESGRRALRGDAQSAR